MQLSNVSERETDSRIVCWYPNPNPTGLTIGITLWSMKWLLMIESAGCYQGEKTCHRNRSDIAPAAAEQYLPPPHMSACVNEVTSRRGQVRWPVSGDLVSIRCSSIYTQFYCSVLALHIAYIYGHALVIVVDGQMNCRVRVNRTKTLCLRGNGSSRGGG